MVVVEGAMVLVGTVRDERFSASGLGCSMSMFWKIWCTEMARSWTVGSVGDLDVRLH